MAQDVLLGQIQNKVRNLEVPVSITLWDGRRVGTADGADVDVMIRSPKVLTALVHPSMGKLARHYVEQQLDLKGEPRQIMRLGEALSGTPSLRRERRFLWALARCAAGVFVRLFPPCGRHARYGPGAEARSHLSQADAETR